MAPVTAHAVAAGAENARGSESKRQLSTLKYFMSILRVFVVLEGVT